MSKEYHTIISLQGTDYQSFKDSSMEPLDYLNQWNYGGENLHSPSSVPLWGTADELIYQSKTENGETYYIYENTGLEYVSLTLELEV